MISQQISIKAIIALLHDILASLLAWVFAHFILSDLYIATESIPEMLKGLLVVVPLQLFLFWSFGLYRGIWRYTSLLDMGRIGLAVATAGFATLFVLQVFKNDLNVPRAVFVLNPILLLLMVAGTRLSYRAWREYMSSNVRFTSGKPVIVLGAGSAAVSLMRDLKRSKEWKVVGLLDDNLGKQGRNLQGIRVHGRLDELAHWAQALQAKHAIIAMPSESYTVRRRAIELCTNAGLSALTVPSYEDLIGGKVSISQMRKVEVEDLLRRDPIVLDSVGIKELINNQCVMVSGAGGSIGSELCRQIAVFQPGLLLLFELNEFALYKIEQEFLEKFPGIKLVSLMGDVKNRDRVKQVLDTYRPQVIFHAAAYKHVPLVEESNAWEAIRNNVLGTYTIASEAVAHDVNKFVMVSTDKAVNPTNVMGASKRLAEMVCQSLQNAGETKFEMVRFGNVLASAGSVIPKFQEQIAKGGPVTVTHPDIIRFFMSIPEAAQLVLQAGHMGKGGEIFVMDMGEPIKIVDLARDIIRLSGFSEDEIKITFTGLRPGEKLFEELLADDELTRPTPHPKLRIARAREVNTAWLEQIQPWFTQTGVQRDNDVRSALKKWVPEYSFKSAELTNPATTPLNLVR
ncbi:MAG: nucleoside-diphosphate sugar epimerase/dehydratase [Burkholderiales bacterium]